MKKKKSSYYTGIYTEVKKLPYGTKTPDGKFAFPDFSRNWGEGEKNAHSNAINSNSSSSWLLYRNSRSKKYWTKTIFATIFFITSCIYFHGQLSKCGGFTSKEFQLLIKAVNSKINFFFLRSFSTTNSTSESNKIASKESSKRLKTEQKKQCIHSTDIDIKSLIKETYKTLEKRRDVLVPKDRKSFIKQQCRKKYEKAQLADIPFTYSEVNGEENFSNLKEDYALKSTGGEILGTVDTEPYGESVLNFHFYGYYIATFPNIWFRKQFEHKSASSVIEPWLQPGDCWAFKGSRGKVRIKLSDTILIKAVSMEHIPIDLTPDFNVDSAPRQFSLIGFAVLEKNNFIKRNLGTFEYRKSDAYLQTFTIRNTEVGYPYKVIELHILSNHGKKEFTCVYRFRVHGEKYFNKGIRSM